MPTPSRLVTNSPAALTSDEPRRITVRRSTCRCGCGGRDPWHQRSYLRAVREVTVLPEPVALADGLRAEVARGKVKLPWGEVEARAVVWTLGEGRWATFADWELVEVAS